MCMATAVEDNAFESDAPVTEAIEGLETIANILCFDLGMLAAVCFSGPRTRRHSLSECSHCSMHAGGTLYDSVESVTDLTKNLEFALDTARRVPFPQISKPARILYNALSQPVSAAEDSGTGAAAVTQKPFQRGASA